MGSPAVHTGPPSVRLRNAFARPYDAALAAARTCYAPRVVEPDEVSEAQRASIGPLTFEAGHHTVFQHAHFEFGLENVSRQFVWAFLHAHPFYNSEQTSQRYVEVKPGAFAVPPLADRGAAQVVPASRETTVVARSNAPEPKKSAASLIVVPPQMYQPLVPASG